MKKSYIDNFKRKYPFSFIPFLFDLPNKSNPEYKETLNSLSLRHPDRTHLKKIIENNYSNENKISFSTENMAEILSKQKKYSEAIKIYEKLISNNSKKKIYFAKKIKKLKNKDV